MAGCRRHFRRRDAGYRRQWSPVKRTGLGVGVRRLACVAKSRYSRGESLGSAGGGGCGVRLGGRMPASKVAFSAGVRRGMEGFEFGQAVGHAEYFQVVAE